jgi:hypothetical protein
MLCGKENRNIIKNIREKNSRSEKERIFLQKLGTAISKMPITVAVPSKARDLSAPTQTLTSLAPDPLEAWLSLCVGSGLVSG